MSRARIIGAGLILAATLGLAACAGNYGGGYGSIGYAGGYNSGYDRYYGDAFGYRSVPYGYVGSNFGWYGNSYYPGTGVYIYDRRGHRRQWSSQHRSYWQNRGRLSPEVRQGGRADWPGRQQNLRQDNRRDRGDNRGGGQRGGRSGGPRGPK